MKKLLVLAVSALAMTLITAAPASAESHLGIGTDGGTFSAGLDGPLFDPDIRWVPGDVRTATFYVRNQGATPARLVVDLQSADLGGLLASGSLLVTAVAAGGTSTAVADQVDDRLLTVPAVVARGVVPVNVTVTFDPSAANDTQLLSSDLRFEVNLRQNAAVGERETPGTEQQILGILPNTGAMALWWIVALAALCLGTGFGLLSRRTTHEEGASHG